MNWTDWSEASEMPLWGRDDLAAQAVAGLEKQPLPCSYVFTMDTLAIAIRLPNGEVRLFDCKVRRHSWDARPSTN